MKHYNIKYLLILTKLWSSAHWRCLSAFRVQHKVRLLRRTNTVQTGKMLLSREKLSIFPSSLEMHYIAKIFLSWEILNFRTSLQRSFKISLPYSTLLMKTSLMNLKSRIPWEFVSKVVWCVFAKTHAITCAKV
jgi:hypothetical protein